jgi:hypothetical protein
MLVRENEGHLGRIALSHDHANVVCGLTGGHGDGASPGGRKPAPKSGIGYIFGHTHCFAGSWGRAQVFKEIRNASKILF